MNTQDWFPLGLTGWISLQSKGLSRVFSNTTVQKHQFFSTQLSLWSRNHLGNFINTHVSDLAPLIRISFVWGMFWASGFHLFIYFGGCAETSSLHGLFSSCSELLSDCSEQASHCNGFSCCVAWALECIVFSSNMHGLKVAAPRCYSTGSIVVAHGLYSSIACDSWAREQTCAFCTGWRILYLGHQGSPMGNWIFKKPSKWFYNVQLRWNTTGSLVLKIWFPDKQHWHHLPGSGKMLSK